MLNLLPTQILHVIILNLKLLIIIIIILNYILLLQKSIAIEGTFLI